MKTRERLYKKLGLLAAMTLLMTAFMAAFATTTEVADATNALRGVEAQKLAEPVTADSSTSKLSADLKNASGSVEVVVQLTGAPVSKGGNRANIIAAQNALASNYAKYGVTELGRMTRTLNAIIVQTNAANLSTIAKDSSVRSLRTVGSYSMDLSNTVPYIGATAAQNAGYTGAGLTVAVMDSGIDYTHRNLGGPGTVADYNTCYAQNAVAPTGICATLFGPTAPKVIGGIDFVGETWPSGARVTDPNPIDFEGHGSHVADIIAGKSADGTHKGVAPDAKIVSIKVCSAVATSCNGVALLLAVDYVSQYNLDHPSNKISVVNLSLGQDYGQQEDDLSQALGNLVDEGVVVVASAGNGSNHPYKVGSPSMAAGVISVAQTQVPNAYLFPIKTNLSTLPGGLINDTTFLEWAGPIIGQPAVTAPVQYGVGTNKIGCDPFPAGSLAGKIALIDRGTCSISFKVAHAQAAGAVGVLIGLIAPGPSIGFSFGGIPADLPANYVLTIPAVVITQADANKVKAGLTAGVVTASFDEANKISLAGRMVSSSSRGPSISSDYLTSTIKPDIGAPGASVSLEVGTGTGETAFGGTSGAAPMVSGSALLLLSKYPGTAPFEVKANLMNNAFTDIKNEDGLDVAPITRIGGGEVRVYKAITSTTRAYGMDNANAASLSFGYLTIGNTKKTLSKTVRLHNYSSTTRTYTITPSFRYNELAAGGAFSAAGAVTPSAPSSITLAPGAIKDFVVKITIDGSKLSPWPFSLDGLAGQNSTNANAFTGAEVDGYLKIDGGTDNTVTLPWHVLPHKAADVAIGNNAGFKAVGQSVRLTNAKGAVAGGVDVFTLLGHNNISTLTPGTPGSNFVLVDLNAFGVREIGPYMQFAITTFGQRALPHYPGGFEVDIDTNGDSVADYAVYNNEPAFGDGRSLVYVQKLTGTSATAYFFAIADYNSSNVIFTLPTAALGLTAGQTFGAQVLAYDNYFSGAITDVLPDTGFATYKQGQPKYALSTSDYFQVAPGATVPATILGNPAASATSGEGLLLFFSDAAPAKEADIIVINS